jgi:hypothetical protein
VRLKRSKLASSITPRTSPSNHHRQHDDVERRRRAEPRGDAVVLGGHVGEQDLALLERALPHQPGAEAELGRRAGIGIDRVAGEQLQSRLGDAAIEQVEDRALRVHHRRQLGEDQSSHREQVALALQHAAELGEVGLEPVLLRVLERGLAQVADHLVGGVLEDATSPRASTLISRVRSPLVTAVGHVGDRAHLSGQVGGELVDVLGEVLPRAGGAGHARLAAELAFHTHLARHRGHLVGEGGERVDHRVDGFRELRDLALGLERQLAPQLAVGHRGHHARDAAHLAGEVGRHRVHVVGEVFPHARHALHLGLAAELAFGAHLARHAGHFGGERAELVHHAVDGVLQLEDLALHVHRDLAREVAVGHRLGHVGDVAHLRGEVGRP